MLNDAEKNTTEIPQILSNKDRSVLRTIRPSIVLYGLIGIIALLFFRHILIPGTVPSASMSPTLNPGDYIVANGLSYLFADPQRGDIVCFRSQEFEELMVKRVIGVPGDEISFHDGSVFINGEIQDELYLDSSVKTNSPRSFTVPDGCYFMLGDNRGDSLDSRYWDSPFIDKRDIIGEYAFTVFHFDQ